MDIGKALKDSWELFAKDALALIVGALIVVLLGSLSLGIVIVPLVAGLYLMIMRRVREGGSSPQALRVSLIRRTRSISQGVWPPLTAMIKRPRTATAPLPSSAMSLAASSATVAASGSTLISMLPAYAPFIFR